MPFKSPHPHLDIPQCNILSYIFPAGEKPSTKPIWIEASDPSNSLSPAQMLVLTKRFAMGLDGIGIPKGAAVMVYTPSHIYVPMVYLASAGSGRCFTGANPNYTIDEVAFQIKNVKAAAMFAHSSNAEKAIRAAKQGGLSLDRIFLFDEIEQQELHGLKDWRTMAATEEESKNWQWDPMEGKPSTTTVATINYSSGTTGLPKGVCVTHANLVANSMQLVQNRHAAAEHGKIHTPEVWLSFLPLYHAFNQMWAINIACKVEASVYVMRKFAFEEFLQCLEKYKVTALQAVPPVLLMLCKRQETNKYNISSLKHVVCGAAPLSAELQNEVKKRFNLIVCQGWGMSETTSAGIVVPGTVDDHSGSIGWLLANTEAKLVDDDGNEINEEGVPGELYVRGPHILLEYWHNEEATNESKTPDGWFKTGDVAVTREDRWWIVDRKKELIKVNGLQVAPAELEAILIEHEGIADAAVTGIVIREEEWPIAYVVLQEGARVSEQDVKDFVAGRVSKHKQLAGGVNFIQEVPKLASGKIVRKVLKQWAKRDAEVQSAKMKSKF